MGRAGNHILAFIMTIDQDGGPGDDQDQAARYNAEIISDLLKE